MRGLMYIRLLMFHSPGPWDPDLKYYSLAWLSNFPDSQSGNGENLLGYKKTKAGIFSREYVYE